MAIKPKKTEVEKPSIPAKLDDLLLQGFSYQAIRDQYDVAFKVVKEEVEGYLDENDDGFDVEKGVSFRCEQGMVCYTSRSNYAYDKDKLIELVDNGTITLATLIELATFPAEKLKTALGEKNFSSVATNTPTESLTFKANPEFKDSVQEKFKDVLPKADPVVESKPVASAKKVIEAVKVDIKSVEAKSKAAKAKALATKTVTTITTVTSVDDDLNSILGE